MEIGKKTATKILTGFGFRVEVIPEADSPRADLLVADGRDTYVFEAKDKYEDYSVIAERAARFARNDLFEQSDTIAHDNRIKGVLRKARDQLDHTPKEDRTFQLIWFHATGIDADTKNRQAFATFYGHVYAIPMYPHSGKDAVCFYFDYNAGFEMPTVEALILSDKKSLQLCLNEFSNRAEEFRASRLFQEFLQRGGVCDPLKMESEGTIICLRSFVPRKHDPDICQALKDHTGILYNPVRLTRHAVSCGVPQRP